MIRLLRVFVSKWMPPAPNSTLPGKRCGKPVESHRISATWRQTPKRCARRATERYNRAVQGYVEGLTRLSKFLVKWKKPVI